MKGSEIQTTGRVELKDDSRIGIQSEVRVRLHYLGIYIPK